MDECFAECVIPKKHIWYYDVVTDHYDFALFHIRLTMIFYSSFGLWRCVLFHVKCFQDLVLTLPMRVVMCCNSKLMEPLLLTLPQQFPNLASPPWHHVFMFFFSVCRLPCSFKQTRHRHRGVFLIFVALTSFWSTLSKHEPSHLFRSFPIQAGAVIATCSRAEVAKPQQKSVHRLLLGIS